MNADLLKKVKKLLALAGSCNEHEARLATEKAQALMLRHNLNMQSLESISDFEIHAAGNSERSISRESGYIMGILTKHFFVRCFYDSEFIGFTRTGKRQYRKISKIVGTPENVEVAKYVYEFLLQTYRRLWKDFSKTHSNKLIAAKNSFFFGVTEGIKETLAASESKICTEMGLVIVPDTKIKSWMSDKLNLKSRSLGRLSSDGTAQAAGKELGKNVKISRALNSDSSNNGRLLN